MARRAVIYARYSSELQRDASIEDQIRLCRARIEREIGWTYLTAYTDHAISGTIRLRPGYQKLLEDARQGLFDILVAEALDRLSRDQEDVAALYKHLAFAGVTLVTVAEGEISELHVGLKGTMNALFLKDLAQKVRRGLEGRVREGKSGGGLCYGYEVTKQYDARGEPVHGGRAIHPAEAAVVRRVFAEYAAGRSPRAIAKALNADGIAAPSGKPWGASTIHGNWRRGTGILNNELYRGRLVWNKLRYIKDPRTGKRVSRLNPESEWVAREVPELRLIDDELWRAVKARQGAHQNAVERTDAGGYRLNATHRRRYLFSGVLVCGACGGAYTITGRERYGCANRRNRGTCSNRLTIGRRALEERVLAGLKEKLMAPALVAEFIRSFHEEVNRRARESEAAWKASQRELAEIERKIEAVLRAIEDGIYTPATKGRLLELERRRDALTAIKPVAPVPRLHPNLADVYAQKVARLTDTLNEPGAREEAAEILRGLIEEIRLMPSADGDRLDLELYGHLAAILALTNGSTANRPGSGGPRRLSLVAGAGFEPATFRL